MTKKILTLAISFAVTGVVAGNAFADNVLDQLSFGDLSPNVAALSNNDVASGNLTDAFNDKSVGSDNDLSTNNSGNVFVPIIGSGNDLSTTTIDSHDDLSDNQLAFGQVNLNDSAVGAINAADNGSTIFDGDVVLLGGGGLGGNVNTGILSNSILGNNNAQFSNVGIGVNNAGITNSTLNNNQTTNINALSL